MQTLRRLFLKKFLREWFLITIGASVFGFLVLYFKDMLSPFIVGMTMLFVIFGPIAHAGLTNNEFQDNLDWLINFQYNRKQLIKFYFTNQTIKLVLVTITYTIANFVTELATTLKTENIPKETAYIDDMLMWFSSSANQAAIYFLILVAIYFVYFVSLFKANWEALRRTLIKRDTNNLKKTLKWLFIQKSDRKGILTVLGWIIVLFAIVLVREAEILSFFVLFSALIGYFSLYIFNRRFKVFSEFRGAIIAYGLAFVLMIPHAIFYIGSITDINNKRADVKVRLNGLRYVGGLYEPKHSTLKKIFSQLDKCSQFYSFGSYAGKNEIAPKYFIHDDLDYCEIKNLVKGYTWISDETKHIPELVHIIESYVQKKKYSFEKQIQLASMYRGEDMPQRYINSLISNDSYFKKYLALKMAKRSMDYRKYKTFVKANYDQLPKEIKDLGSVKRAIASANEAKKSKKKKKFKFNVNHY